LPEPVFAAIGAYDEVDWVTLEPAPREVAPLRDGTILPQFGAP
jgi:hypothetical protein